MLTLDKNAKFMLWYQQLKRKEIQMFKVNLEVYVIGKGGCIGNIFRREIELPFMPYVGAVLLLQVGPNLYRFVIKTVEWMEGFNKFNVALQDINPEQEPEMVFFFPKNWKGLRVYITIPRI